jgi:phosphoglycerate dehydrogenase-like enzyme
MPEVLYLQQPGNTEPWLEDFLAAAEDRIDYALFDEEGPLAPQFAGVRVVIDQGGHGTPAMIDAGAAAGVTLWQALTTGLDHTNVDHILASGMQLTHAPGLYSAVALAEHAMMLMLALAKRLHEAERNCRTGTMYLPVSDELEEQVLGVVGLGASGSELARRAAYLGMRVRAVDPSPIAPDQLAALGVERLDGLDGLDDLLAGSDVISLHVPLEPATVHLIDARRIALMKPTATLINVARGRLVDEAALVEALRAGTLARAGIDVFAEEPVAPDNPLFALDNVIATPHTAGITRGTSRRRNRLAVDNALRVLAGEPPLHLVGAGGQPPLATADTPAMF